MSGRPTKFTPEICNKVICLMREGASIIEVAYELNVARSTIYEWIDNFDQFSDTIKMGKDFSEGWWMKEGRCNLTNKDFNSTLFYMNMRNRFGWGNKQDHENNATKHEDALKELE